MANGRLKLPAFWHNPVLVRDMRVSLRTGRAFIGIGIYLGLLILLAAIGYIGCVRTQSAGNLDPNAVQNSLKQIYNFIFVTLATLVVLIAPSISALAIVSEKQRQTYDLIRTSPLTSVDVLAGKLASSIAYLFLLLVISMPLSEMCVMFGGASIANVLQTYAILLIDGVVLAAIGLTFSCTTRNYVQSLAGTYAVVILAGLFTYVWGTQISTSLAFQMSSTAQPLPYIYALAEFNPILAVTSPGSFATAFGRHLPVWWITAVLAVLIVRLLLTVGALRASTAANALIASFRRQILLIAAAGAFGCSQYWASIADHPTASTDFDLLSIEALCLFAIGAFFFPGLFVPVVDEDAPPGQAVRGRYNVRHAFNGMPGGSLPFYQMLVVAAFAGFVGGIGVTDIGKPSSLKALPLTGLSVLFYFSALGFLYWSICRLSYWLTGRLSVARPVSFFINAAVHLMPLIFFAFVYHAIFEGCDPDKIPGFSIVYSWVLYPIFSMSDNDHLPSRLTYLWSGAYVYALGAVVFPCWRDFVPRAHREPATRKLRKPTKSDDAIWPQKMPHSAPVISPATSPRRNPGSLWTVLVDNPMIGESKRHLRRIYRNIDRLGRFARLAVVFFAVLIYLFIGWLLWSARSDSTCFLDYVELVLIALVIPASIFGAISGERERATWDNLVLTKITPWQMIVGKLVWRFRLLLIIFGVMMPLIIVSRWGLPSVALSVLSTTTYALSTLDCNRSVLFWGEADIYTWGAFLCALGLWISSLNRRAVTSFVVIWSFLVLAYALVPAVYFLIGLATNDSSFVTIDTRLYHVLMFYNPFTFIGAESGAYATWPENFGWKESALNVAATIVLMFLTATSLARTMPRGK